MFEGSSFGVGIVDSDSINQLASDLDVPPNRVSAIVSGKRSITADTALRLGTYFRVSPETWLGLKMDNDLRLTS